MSEYSMSQYATEDELFNAMREEIDRLRRSNERLERFAEIARMERDSAREPSYKDIAKRLKMHKDTVRIAAREMYRLGKADRIINPENPSQYMYRGKRWAE